jgi:Flp pilus assembly protein TadG
MNRFSFENRKRGATLPLLLFLLIGLLGAAALAIDLSMMNAARQRAQVVADAAALAGAASPASAGVSANLVIAANNAVGTAFIGASVRTASGGAVTVHGSVNAPLSFAPAVGYAPTGADGSANTLTVSASATAAMSAVCALPVGMPVAPFGLIGDDPANTDPAVAYVSALLSGAKMLMPGAYQAASTQVMLRMNLWDTTGSLTAPGSFDPLLISGTGAGYQSTILHLSDQPLSAGQALSTPALIYDNTALTRAGIAARLAPSNMQFTHMATSYDAWYSAGQPQNDGHLMLIPVISQAVKNKMGNVSIIAFATFFISQTIPSQDASNNIVYGRFLSLVVPGASGGICTSAGTLTPAHLIL